MKKLLIGILILFLVALVPSVMAAAPTTSDTTVTTTEDTAYTFSVTDFPFSDTDSDLLASVKITALETVGDLELSGVDVDVDDVIVVGSIGNLVFTPVSDGYGVGYDSFEFTVIDNSVSSEESTRATMTIDVDAENDANWKTTPTSVSLAEDVIDASTLDLADYVVKPTSMPSSALVYGVDKASLDLTTVDVELSGSQVIFTPVANEYGDAGSVTFSVTDGAGVASEFTVSVTVTAVNDAPVLEDVNDFTLQEKLSMGTLTLPEAVDVDDFVLTYTLTVVDEPEDSTFDVTIHYDGTTISGWEPTKDDVGELKLRLTADDGEFTSEQEFSVHVYPKYMCEEGEVGTAFEVTIEEPEDNDDFGPGDMIKIEVTVDNEDSSDKDVVVVAMLYDLEDHKKIAEVESDDENLDEDGEDDEEFTFNLELQVPLDSDEDYDGDYVLYVKVYEEGEEDNECLSRMVELDLSRESHEVIIQSMTITPSTVNPGDTVDILVSVLNVGKKDEDSVLVKLRAEDLRIDLTSEARNLGAFDELGSGYTFTFRNVEIPSDADAETVDFSDTYVLFDSGTASTSYLDSPTFNLESSGLTVEESSMLTTGATTAEPEADEVTEVEEEGFPWSTVLWVLGDVVLIIVALFFLKLIFSGRRRVPEVKEVKL